MQRIATDLRSSKDQLTEVKELLLRLINPQQSNPPSTSTAAPTSIRVCAGDDHGTLLPPSGSPEVVISPEVAVVSLCPLPPRELCSSEKDGAGARGPPIPVNVTLGGGAESPSPSWASSETIPVTPNSFLQKFTNSMPIGAAVLTEVSASIRTSAGEHSPHTSIDNRGQQKVADRSAPAKSSVDIIPRPRSPTHSHDGVNTRQMTTALESEAPVRVPRPRFDYGLLPRITDGALAANCLCFVSHPDTGTTIVAKGRTGGSWKSPSQRYGNLCGEGEQMVQLHKINVPNLRLVFIEDRQPFTVMEHALGKSSGSSVYVKWQSRMLIKKPKAVTTKKAV